MRKYSWDYQKPKKVKNPYYQAKKRAEESESKKQGLLKLQGKLKDNPTPEEQLLWEALIEHRIDFEFQHILSNHKHAYIVDFYINLNSGRVLIVECDGFYHFTGNGRERDRVRDARIHSIFKYKVMRVSNSEIKQDMRGVLFKILCYEPKKVPK